jgi:positive regulator of sigma E activity
MGKKKIIYAAPLLGILAGTLGMRLVLKIGIAAPLLARAYELPLGPGIFSADNLTLAGGFLGLAVSALIAARMARRLAGHTAHEKDGGKADAQT